MTHRSEHVQGCSRRGFVTGGSAALASPLLAGRAWAETYPSRPIDLVIPYPPGGGADLFARIVAKGLEGPLGQPIIPINKPGAGTVIGTNAVKNARRDGYTLLFASSAFLINTVVRSVDYDPTTDFAPIGMIGRAIYVLVSNPKRGFKTVGDLIAYGKAHPNALRFGSPGVGVSGQLAGDLLRHLGGISFLDVRYKGASEAVLATMSGETDFCFDSPAAVSANVKTGRLTLLGGASETRDPIYPDLPTIAETLPGYSVWPWFAVLAPAGTPAPVLDVLRAALTRIEGDPTLQKRMSEAGAEVFGKSAAEFTQFLETDRVRWNGIAAKEKD